MLNECIYFMSLFVCVILGDYYKRIPDPEQRRNYGAGLGMLVACSICGRQIVHSILLVWGNIIIIKYCDKKYVHQFSMVFTWMFLIFLYSDGTTTQYSKWLYQVLALRLTGLAFELHIGEKFKSDDKIRTSVIIQDTHLGLTTTPSTLDIVTYAYFYIGLHKAADEGSTHFIANRNGSYYIYFVVPTGTQNYQARQNFCQSGGPHTQRDSCKSVNMLPSGPYYRWKTFDEHVRDSFGDLGACRAITELKLKNAAFCAIVFFLLRFNYSSKIYYTDELYETYDADYRFLYNVPLLVMYYLQCQILALLCNCVCTEAGFGVYPSKCQPMPGMGPSTNISLINLATESQDVALEQEYSFAMLKCFDRNKVLMGPRMKDTIRGWDMPTQHWFWLNVYKNTIKSNKEVRSAYSLLAWSIWSGPSMSQLITSITLWVYVNLESEYSDICDANGPDGKLVTVHLVLDDFRRPWTPDTLEEFQLRTSWYIGYSIMRILCLTYLTPCFYIGDYRTVLRYYNSIYWIFHVLLCVLIAIAVVIFKRNIARDTEATASGSTRGKSQVDERQAEVTFKGPESVKSTNTAPSSK